AVNDLAYLLRRARLLGVDGPEKEFLHIQAACQVAECAFAAHQPASLRIDGLDALSHRLERSLDPPLVGSRIGTVMRRVFRVMLGQRSTNVVDIDERIVRTHPGMRIGRSPVLAGADLNGHDNLIMRHTSNISVTWQHTHIPRPHALTTSR